MANGQVTSSSETTPDTSCKARRKPTAMISRANPETDCFISLLHGSDPVRLELTRLENELQDKERELGDAQTEIKALKYSDRLKEKAVEELTDELQKLDDKLKLTEALLESKNLETKKINDEKKEALAAQFAAEATLRRVHAAQKDDGMPPMEAIIVPLEAELKLARLEVAKLQDDNRALERLTKSKEAALLEAEKTVQTALAKAALVDDLQNKNQDLMKQIEMCQEENRILDKMHRQKVAEVEKLTQTVRELEEAVLAGGAAANAVRDYQRKVQEMNEERKMLDRELARAKVSANRVAVVVANDWKDANDKVMPVKQWLEERRFIQGEMQQLRDKLAVAERTAKAEGQLKEKFQLRFKVLEEKLKITPNAISHTPPPKGRSIGNGHLRRQSIGGAENLPKSSSNGYLSKKSNGQTGPFASNASDLLKNLKTSSGSPDGECRPMNGDEPVMNTTVQNGNSFYSNGDQKQICEKTFSNMGNGNFLHKTGSEILGDKMEMEMEMENGDYVSGVLYDMLQKEVVSLRKACREKDQRLRDKDDSIEMLAKKVETLNKAMEVEAKKMKREMAAMEKEVAAIRISKDQDHRNSRINTPRAAVNGLHSHPLRYTQSFKLANAS